MRNRILFLKMRSLCILGGAFALTTLRSFNAQADDASSPEHLQKLAEIPIEELVKVRVTTIASGTEQPVSEAPAIATVITAQDIQAMGATTLEEALESVPGLHVSPASLYGPKYLIRGGYSTHYNPEVLVMVNGVSITSIFRGDRNVRLGVLPIKMVSKIEVIRGPGSALYGADALTGVINVVTKDSADIKGIEAGGQVGSYNTQEAWLLHGKNYDGLKATLMADFRVTDGQQGIITADAQTALDRKFGTQASLAPGPVNLSEKGMALFLDLEESKWRLRGSYFGKWNLGSGQGIADALDPVNRSSRVRSTVDLTYSDPKIGENWDLTSRLSYLSGSQEEDKNLTIFPPGANLGNGVFPNGVIGNPEFWERQFRFDNSAFYTGVENHKFRFGAGYFYADIYKVKESKNFTNTFAPRPGVIDVTDTPDVYLPENSRNSFYGYLQDEWKLFPDWELTAGLRYDHYSDFGGTLNPRAALVWKTTPKLTTKFLFGRAFRAPNLTELYTMNNPVLIGNPNLNPETSLTYEIGWVYQANSNWHFGLNVFHYDVNDIIALVRDPVGTATAQNDGSESGNGFEFETKIKAADTLFLTGNYSFVKATDQTTGKPVGDYPGSRVYLRDDWAFLPNWTWGNQLNWVGTRDREPADPREPLAGYATVDVILRRTAILDRLSAVVAIRNIFDADVREPSAGPGPTATSAAIPNDLPMPGRNFYAELVYHL